MKLENKCLVPNIDLGIANEVGINFSSPRMLLNFSCGAKL